MSSLVNADRVINELYRGNPNAKISKKKTEEAAAKAEIAPDVMTYFRHLPERDYTKQELIDELNRMVKARHRVREVGLFGTGEAEKQAEREANR